MSASNPAPPPAAGGAPRLGERDLARVLARTPLLQAAWNYERHQGVGWAYCMEPVLERLYPDPAQRAVRLTEHLGYFNTQPTLASFALGAVASLEEARAGAEAAPLGAGEINRVKTALGSALAAVGDLLFWSTARPLAAVLGVLTARDFGAWGALALLVVYDAMHLTLRARGIWVGYRMGPGVMSGEVRRGLQNATRRLAALGSVVCGLLFAALLVPGPRPVTLGVQAALIAGMVAGLLTALRARPSATVWALVGGALCVLAAWR